MDMNERRQKRLREILRTMTQAELAAASGVAPSYISRNLKEAGEKNAKVIGETTARKYERGARKPEGWLDGLSNVEQAGDIKGLVPLISWVQAGNWEPAHDPLQPGEAEQWMPCIASHSKSTYALRVRGDSMTAPHGNTRTYPEGCIIFVDPERRSPINGDRIIARQEGEEHATFKVYKNEDGRQWLQPLNPGHEPMRQPFTVLGTIIGKWEDG